MGTEVNEKTDVIKDRNVVRSVPPSPSAQIPASPTITALITALQAYRQAIENLPAERTKDYERLVVETLMRRDDVANALAKELSIPQDIYDELLRSDQLLQKRASEIEFLLGTEILASWREALQPRTNLLWWWSLDKRAAENDQKHGAFWLILTGFTVTLSLCFAFAISSRFFSIAPDNFGIISTASQFFLALLAGSTFTQAGRDWLSSLFSFLKIDRRLQVRGAFLLALMVLLIIIGFWYSLPWISQRYNEEGVEYLKQQQPALALVSFQRALNLRPGYAEAHYHLANVHEYMLEYDKAINEYRRAIEINPGYDFAYNNLARLYMSQHADYPKALDLIDKLLALNPTSKEIKYAAHKNRGWALLGLEFYSLAEEDLRQALNFFDGAEAHYLLAQTLEKEGRKEEALEHYAECAQKAKAGDRIETRWLSVALTRLRDGIK